MDSSAFSEENRMSTALSLSALLLSVAAIFAYQWVTFAPWAGLGLLYRIKRVQLLVAAVAWTCALTAYALKEDAAKSEAAGCDTHLTKPIKKAVLLEAIRQFVRNSGEYKQA